MSEKSKLIFDVSNMKCSGCSSAVTDAIKALDDTEVIEVSLENHQAVVMSSLSVEKVAEAITASGFPAVVNKS